MTLVQITARHFCAGIVLSGDVCIDAAPILRWAVGKGRDELRAYFVKKGWKAIIAVTSQPHDPQQSLMKPNDSGPG